MKIEYKDIVGDLIPEKYSGSCAHCCFRDNQNCIPASVCPCFNTIFKKSESQIFEA